MSSYASGRDWSLCLGDAAEVLRSLEAESVQMTCTSPPYDNLRSYAGKCEWDFESVAKELYRVLCPGGVLCWNVADQVIDGSETLTSLKQAIYFKETVGFRVHDTMIWEKPNFAHPETVRYHQVFEYLFVLSKGAPRCFNPIKDKANVWAGTGCFGKNTMRLRDGSHKLRACNQIAKFGMRGNVWHCKTAGQENICVPIDHPAMMSEELAEGLVLSWSNPGDLVLDPFVGSGTTCAVALRHGRKALGIDVNQDYLDGAIERLRRPHRRPRAARHAEGQGRLEINGVEVE